MVAALESSLCDCGTRMASWEASSGRHDTLEYESTLIIRSTVRDVKDTKFVVTPLPSDIRTL